MENLPLVGRANEFAQLRDLLAKARAADGRCLFVSGEPGVGKTRLCEELQSAAREQGFAVAWGRSWDGEGAPMLWPWIQVLRRLEAIPELTATIAEPALAVVRRLCARQPVARGEPDRSEWFEIADPVVRALVAMSAHTPLLLLLDDMHAADDLSLELLRFALPELRGTRLLVVFTVRDVDARGRPKLGRLLDEVERRDRGIRLDSLAAEDVRELLARSLGVPLPSAVTDMVARRSEGNPLLVLEIGRLLATAPVAGFLTASDLPIPARVIDGLRGRLQALRPEPRALIEVAAVIGREPELDILLRAAPFDQGTSRQALDGLCAAGLLRLPEPGRYAFAQAVHRSAIYRDIPADDRARLHLRVARVLQPLADGGDLARCAQVAYHFERAVTPGTGGTEQSRYEELAGEHASSVGGHGEAARHFFRARDLTGEDTARLRVSIRLAEEQRRLGRAAEARSTLEDAAILARRLGAADSLTRIALLGGHPAIDFRPDPWLVEILTEAGAAMPPEASERPLLEARLAAALGPSSRHEQRNMLAERALAAARAAGAQTLAPVLSALVWAHGHPQDLEARAERARQLLRFGEDRADPEMQLRGRLACTLAVLEREGPLAAGYQLDAARALAVALEHPYFTWLSGMYQATLLLAADQVAEADAAAADALAWGQQHGFPRDALICYVLTLAPIRVAQGRGGELPALVAALEVEAPEHPGLAGLRLEALLSSGLRAAAHAALDIDLEAIPRDLQWLSTTTVLAEAALELEERDRAAELSALLAPFGSVHVVAPGTGVYRGPVARTLSRLAASLGRESEARAHHEHARALCQASGSRLAIRLLEADLSPRATPVAPVAVEPPSPAVALGAVVSLVHEGETWVLSGSGRSLRLRDSKGLRYLAELLMVPGRPVHVVDLVTTDGAVDAGDAGEQLDDEAVRSYRRRLNELDDIVEEADRWGDLERARRARTEREMVLQELAGGVGLGGRKRRAGSTVERMRQAVTKRLRDLIRRVAEHDTWLGTHLTRSVRTGRTCVYEPSIASLSTRETLDPD